MIERIVQMKFKQDAVEGFLRLFEDTKEKIRNQPGCHHLELWRDAHDSTRFATYSRWDSEGDLNAYRNTQLFKEVWSATKKGFDSSPKANSFKRVSEVG